MTRHKAGLSQSRNEENRPAAHPFGFAEAQAPFVHAAPSPAPSLSVESEREGRPVGKITLGAGGRLVVPAEVRASLRLAEGDVLVASVVDGELRLMPVATAVQRAQAYVRATIGTVKESVVDEFIREKRQEQLLEDLKN